MVGGDLQLGNRRGIVRGLHGGERSGSEPFAIARVGGDGNGHGRLRGIGGGLVAILNSDVHRHIALLACLTGHASNHTVGLERTGLGIGRSSDRTPNYRGSNGRVSILHVDGGRQRGRGAGGGRHALQRSDCRRFAISSADFPLSNGHGGIAAIHSLTGHVEL